MLRCFINSLLTLFLIRSNTMKLKIVYSLFFMFLVLFINNVKTFDNQYFTQPLVQESLTDYDKLLQSLCTPKFTRSGMRCFLKHTFNRKEFAQEVLPHTFHPLIQFLEYGKKSGQESGYIQSTLRLFNNKIKSCKYITSDALSQVLARFPELIKDYVVEQPQVSWFVEAKNIVKKILYTTFLSGFSLFKKDPEQFFNGLSQNVQTLHHSAFVQKRIARAVTTKTIGLLETMMSKVIWSPLDQAETWVLEKIFPCI